MKTEKNKEGKDKIRMTAIVIVSLFVIAAGIAFSLTYFMKGDITGGIASVVIATTILVFAISVFIRGYKDMKKGFPLRDERSRKVIEKASSRAFYASLYLLLAVGFLSDDLIKFRDVSQATGIAVGGMGILFAVFWAYYNKKEI